LTAAARAERPAGAVDLRRATAADGMFLAEMIDLSNAGGDRADFARAMANVLAPGSDVSFNNAIIMEVCGTPAAAMVVNAPLRAQASLSSMEPQQLHFEALKANAAGMLYLRNIAVVPRFTGISLASVLVGAALNMASLCDAAGLCAIVHHRNEAMRKLMRTKGLAVAHSGFLPSHPHFPDGIELDLWAATLTR
jgi:hypothetical protein